MSNITVLQNIPTDRSIKLNVEGQEETYSLKIQPAFTSKLVRASEKEILQDLSLNSVISNLKNAADLIFVAYNALAGADGGKLQAKMSGLQKSLLDLTGDCITTVQGFESCSQEVITYTMKSYKWLFDGNEKLAITQLVRCGEIAGKMADEAQKLAERFKELGDKSQLVLEDSIKEEGLQEHKRLEMIQKLNELKANQVNAQKLQQELQIALDEVQKQYEEARAREKVESERAFTMGLVGAIFGGLAAGLGSAAQIITSVHPATAGPKAMAQMAAGQAGNSQASNNLAQNGQNNDLVKKAEEAQAEKSKLEKETQENEAKIKEAEGIIKDTTNQETKANKEKELQESLKKREELKVKLEAATQALDKISSGLKDLSGNLSNLGNQAHSNAELASKQKMEFFQQKNNLAAENRKTLAALEEYAVRAANGQVDLNNAAAAVETLHYAVQALSQIVVALNQAALFWRSMSAYCKRLQKSEFLNEVKDLQELEKDDRLAYYSEPEFILGCVINLSKWVALNSVCQQYLKAVNETYSQVGKNHATALSIQEAQKQAPILAKKILESVRQEMQVLDVTPQAA
ncbi:hypothetical protein H6G04_00270 [Calothrix membranacea FACHB-236]|nr:hypothetical protein [Calothrix membranacea FACHB-236]